MEGDTVEWGWNAALNVAPIDRLNFAITYRSNIDLDFDETTKLNLLGYSFSPDATISIPLPADLAVSVAYDLLENLNVEFTWNRTFWSEYEDFDFNYQQTIPNNPYEAAVPRNWNDVNAYRLGITWKTSESVTLMGGIAYDESPVPTSTLDFSVPDADAWLFSLGVRYKVNENLELGLAALYDYKEDRSVQNSATDSVYGEFSNVSATLITAGLSYTF